MARVVCFGELMLRLSPPGFERLFQSPELRASFGGGEANVAVSLANFGMEAAFISKLPEGPIGQAALEGLRAKGVDVSAVQRGPGRLGIYFCERGASQRPSKVVYDRADSLVAQTKESDFDWPELLKGSQALHFTGISPALSEGMAASCLRAVKAAKEAGLMVSCDLNYRKKLWSRQRAGEVMRGLMPYVDLLIANEEDLGDVFGIHAPGSDVGQGLLSEDGYAKVAAAAMAIAPFRAIAITLRESHSASRNGWGAMLYSGDRAIFSRRYQIDVVDRVGGGDSFAAGLIFGLLSGQEEARALEFAVAASCLKHSVEGDYNLVGLDEVMALANGEASGRVQR